MRVHAFLPGWLVFGALVNLGEPTADEFTYRQDVRIWKQSHLQALLYAKEYWLIAQFLWTRGLRLVGTGSRKRNVAQKG